MILSTPACVRVRVRVRVGVCFLGRPLVSTAVQHVRVFYHIVRTDIWVCRSVAVCFLYSRRSTYVMYVPTHDTQVNLNPPTDRIIEHCRFPYFAYVCTCQVDDHHQNQNPLWPSGSSKMKKRQAPSSASSSAAAAAAAVDDAPGVLTLSGASMNERGGSGPLSAVGHRGRHGRPQGSRGGGESSLLLALVYF